MEYLHTLFMMQFLGNRTAYNASTLTTSGIMECSSLCCSYGNHCGAFEYDPDTSLCTLIGQFHLSANPVTKYWIKNNHCPIQDGYLHLYDSQYGGEHLCLTLTMNQQKWQDAQDNCLSRGDSLVTLNTQEKTLLLNTYLLADPSLNQIWWIGLKDVTGTNVYIWINGSPVTYLNWFPGQPDYYFNSQDDDCVVLNEATQNFDWNDFNCVNILCSYICEKTNY